MTHADTDTRYTVYEGDATFLRVCRTCGRFVIPDPTLWTRSDRIVEPNATCSKCGRVAMIFEGYM